MFGFARAPAAGMSLAELAGCIAWVAHGFEIVHTRFAGWRFAAADTVADFALHGRLFVGPRVPIDRFVGNGSGDLATQLSSLRLTLSCDGRDVEEGSAEIVLDGPLHALRLWVDAMAARPEQLADRRRRHRHHRNDHRRRAARAGPALADAPERSAFRRHDAEHDRMTGPKRRRP